MNAVHADVVRLLADQFSHMSSDEAKKFLGRLHDPVLTNDEFLDQFEVLTFDPPLVHVTQKANGKRGTLAFIDSPRLYFDFQPEETHDARTA